MIFLKLSMIRATLRQKIFDHKIFLKNKMFLIERSCRETFKNAITRHLIPSEDGEPPTPSWLFPVISGYFGVSGTALLIKERNCYKIMKAVI